MLKLFQKNKDIQIFDKKDGEIYSPIEGDVMDLEKVPDVVFSQKMMGEGIAVTPSSSNVYAPVDGKVSVLFPTGHAIGITADDGLSVIIHIGIDTVELKGEGFSPLIRQGDHVRAGQLIMTIDLKAISKKRNPTTMIVIENSKEYDIENTSNKHVKQGELLLKYEKKRL